MVSWLTVLDSVPDIELLGYLPNFLNGLFKILGDPETVRIEEYAMLVCKRDICGSVRETEERHWWKSKSEANKW